MFVSVPLVGWSHAFAIKQRTNGHIVTQIRNRDAFKSQGLVEGEDFTAIDSEKIAAKLYRINRAFRKVGFGWTATSVFASISYYYFEHLVAKKFNDRIRAGEFDVVHRITPLSPTSASASLSKLCKQANIPFIVGPLNGGAPWPKGYGHVRRQEGEWLSYIRPIYKLMPGIQSTLRNASAIITGSKATRAQIPLKYQNKCVYIPENGIDPDKFRPSPSSTKNPILRAIFIGRLVPYKGADIAIQSAIPFLKSGRLKLDIFGDGPQRDELEGTIKDHQLQSSVTLHGWVDHQDLKEKLSEFDLMLFPSIREFGGGVVLEAMASGIVPVIVDYAGPSELVDKLTGYKVPLGTKKDLINAYQSCLEEILNDSTALSEMKLACNSRIQKHFTWQAKAGKMLEVYEWVCGNRPENPEHQPGFKSSQ